MKKRDASIFMRDVQPNSEEPRLKNKHFGKTNTAINAKCSSLGAKPVKIQSTLILHKNTDFAKRKVR